MSLLDRRLLILVGLTGVGKTTTVEALERSPLGCTSLPGRREITDRKIIAWLQDRDGEPRREVTDRAERFDYTRRYRDSFPGGMVHALASLDFELAGDSSSWLLFDGLRGANEVEHAATSIPLAHFLVLLAPNAVRVARLLGRRDAFDSIANAGGPSSGGEVEELLERHAEMLDDSVPGEIERLLRYGRSSADRLQELEQKLAIVAKEHQNYSALDTVNALEAVAKQRMTVVRTDQLTPDQIVDALLADLDPVSAP